MQEDPKQRHSSQTMKGILAVWMVLWSSVFPLLSRSLLVRSVTARPTAKASTRMSASAATATPSTKTAYDQLVEHLQLLSYLQQSSAVLSYDQLVSMPEQAATARGNQLAALATVLHEQSTSGKLQQLLQEAQPITTDERTVWQLAQHDFDKNHCIPAALEAKKAQLSSVANQAWVQARQNNDFATFAPTLQECFDVCRQTAECRAPLYSADMDLYSILLDEFERGMSKERIDELFGEIEASLVPLLQQVLQSQTQISTDCLNGTFDVEKQQALSKSIVTKLGFDTTKGRIDVSVHPFTTSFSNADVRITSRFRDSEWYQGLAATIHEGGHAMYEQNLGSSNLPIDTALSMGCHESQSLFWERHVGLSLPFMKWLAPQLKESLGISVSPDELYRAANAVQPGLIRVEADELSYPLHVTNRYKMERDIIDGTLDINDLPQAWNQAMLDTLGVTVPTDTEGCLQDVHWCSLAIGYFPTYLIGSATAAQLYEYCRRDIPDIEDKIEHGDFQPIKEWLVEKVHKHGKRYPSLDALLQAQLDEPLNPKYFIEYLTQKYCALYELS